MFRKTRFLIYLNLRTIVEYDILQIRFNNYGFVLG